MELRSDSTSVIAGQFHGLCTWGAVGAKDPGDVVAKLEGSLHSCF